MRSQPLYTNKNHLDRTRFKHEMMAILNLNQNLAQNQTLPKVKEQTSLIPK